MGKLLEYDLMIVWKGARAAFSRKRDWLLLVLGVPILSLLLSESASNWVRALRGTPEPGKMLLVGLTAFLTEWAVGRRLEHLESESVVARVALRRRPRLIHRLFWTAPPLVASVAIMAPGGGSAWPLPVRVGGLVLAYGAGSGAGALARFIQRHLHARAARRRAGSSPMRSIRLAGETRRGRIAALVAARTGLAGPSVAANAAVFAALGASIAGLYRVSLQLLPAPGPQALAGLAGLAAAGLLLRQHPPLLRYLLYLGVEPLAPVLVAALSAGSLAAGFALGAIGLAEAPAFAEIAAAALILFVAVALLRGFHFATRSRRSAELAIQLDLVLILLAGLVAIPLAPALLLARLAMLHRRARALSFVAP
jgi:hypothetical protein